MPGEFRYVSPDGHFRAGTRLKYGKERQLAKKNRLPKPAQNRILWTIFLEVVVLISRPRRRGLSLAVRRERKAVVGAREEKDTPFARIGCVVRGVNELFEVVWEIGRKGQKTSSHGSCGAAAANGRDKVGNIYGRVSVTKQRP